MSSMRPQLITMRARGSELGGRPGEDLLARLRRRVVGQEEAIRTIVPYVELFEAGLSPEGRPVGVFLLLGPTGTGKTRTVEALAEALHGHVRNVLRVDCGEFQMDHEVAKLIGAPPGYLGHRETQPMLTQQRLNAVTSDRSSLSVVLFDEIEKAAPSLTRILLGVLDKATLKLGDNTGVNFERSLIFLTSNLGARELARETTNRWGLAAAVGGGGDVGRMERIALSAMKRRFSPEFVNRIDKSIAYRPLGRAECERILDLQLTDLERLVGVRLGPAAFRLRLSGHARQLLLDEGVSEEYGARELKRVLHRRLIQPLGRLVLESGTEGGGCVYVTRAGRELVLHGKGGLRMVA